MSIADEWAIVRNYGGSSDRMPQTCLLAYDGQRRLCVTAKNGLEELETHADANPDMDGSVSERRGQAGLGGELLAWVLPMPPS